MTDFPQACFSVRVMAVNPEGYLQTASNPVNRRVRSGPAKGQLLWEKADRAQALSVPPCPWHTPALFLDPEVDFAYLPPKCYFLWRGTG